MQILNISLINGPSYWSVNRQKLIVLKLDLQELEERPTDTFIGFDKALEDIMPSLYEHRCSEGRPGGFLTRVKRGTWMGHVVEHIALELQTLAGMNCGFGRTRGAGTKGIYNVIFAYEIVEAGIYAAHAAVNICEKLVKGENYNIKNDIENLKDIYLKCEPPLAITALISEASRKRIPYIHSKKNAFVQLGYGAKQKIIFIEFNASDSKTAIKSISENMYIWHLPEKRSIAFYSDIARNLIYSLFPPRTHVSIPLVAVAGTQGKTIVTNLLGIMAKNDGLIAGIYRKKNIQLYSQKTNFPTVLHGSPKALLKKKDIDVAIFCTAYDSIFHNGLPFSYCDFGVVTNVTPTHYPVPELYDETYVAQAISTIPELVETRYGYAVLNADDDLAYAMRYRTDADFALFSTNYDSKRIARQANNGGISAVIFHDKILITKGGKSVIAINLPQIIDANIRLSSYITAAVLTGFLMGFRKETLQFSVDEFLQVYLNTTGIK